MHTPGRCNRISSPSRCELRGGEDIMMGWGGYGYGGMMGLGFGVLGTIFWLVILVDLVLLGIWLWKQIQKK